MQDSRPIDSLGLAFSGGGLRASLFHLGFVRFLSETRLLQRVKRVSSVSGGSVLAAHLALRWSEFWDAPNREGESDAFHRACGPLIEFARADVRGKILRRWCVYLPGRILGMFWRKQAFIWSNTGRLQAFYESLLFGRTELSQLDGDGKPRFYILATNLTKLDLCYFDHQVFCPAIFSPNPPSPIPAATVPLAYAVAASSCFPGFFGPLEINEQSMRTTLTRLGIEKQQIADGGIFDNLGVRILRKLNDNEAPCDLNIISDAGRACTWEQESSFPHFVSTPIRASDILMSRVGQLEKDAAAELAAQDAYQFITIEPINWHFDEQQRVSPLATDRRTSAETRKAHQTYYELLPHLRTDFDLFTDLEIMSLVQHGYLTARESLWPYRERLGIPENAFFIEPWNPISGKRGQLLVDDSVAKELYSGRSRKVGVMRFFADPLACAPFLLLLSIVITLGWFAKRQYTNKLLSREESVTVPAISSAAELHRRHIVDILRGRRKPDGFWGRYDGAETWATAQAVAGLCKAPETKPEHLREYLEMLSFRLNSYDFLKDQGGWSSDTFRTDSESKDVKGFQGVVHAAPALWMLNAVAILKQRDDSTAARLGQQSIPQLFATLQPIVLQFKGNSGGWRFYPTDTMEECNPFSTAYAVMGMLEVENCGLPLFPDPKTLRREIQSSVEWLENQKVQVGSDVGWNESSSVNIPLRPALSLQVCAALLRAQGRGYALKADSPSLIQRVVTTYGFDTAGSGRAEVNAGQFHGRPVHFAEPPWRIESCHEFVRYLKRSNAPLEIRVSFTRRLRDLLAKFQIPDSEDPVKTYLFALELYALADIEGSP